MTEKVAKNNECSEELKAALYKALQKVGYRVTGGYKTTEHDEDAFDKIDAYYTIDGKRTPVQLRAYGVTYYQNGFPIRDTELQNENEMELLKAGDMDDVLFAFASFVYAPSEWGKYKFMVIKIVKGEDLRKNITNIIGDRTFEDGNHVSFIADPASTEYLRIWK
jgi:hypothetical protein